MKRSEKYVQNPIWSRITKLFIIIAKSLFKKENVRVVAVCTRETSNNLSLIYYKIFSFTEALHVLFLWSTIILNAKTVSGNKNKTKKLIVL